MPVTKITYASSASITIGLNSLATSSTLTAGRESTQVDNTTNLYDDVLVQGVVAVGTTPTSGKTIAVYVWGSDTSLATTALDDLIGTDGACAITNEGVRNGFLKLGAAITLTAATSNVVYPVGPFSVASLFGSMPKYWGLVVTHDTVADLKSSGNTDMFKYTGITYTTA